MDTLPPLSYLPENASQTYWHGPTHPGGFTLPNWKIPAAELHIFTSTDFKKFEGHYDILTFEILYILAPLAL